MYALSTYRRQSVGLAAVLERYRRFASRRWMLPVPKVYLLTFVGGSLVGLGLGFAGLTSWYWWSFGIIAVLGVWTLFMSTIWWGGPRRPHTQGR